MSNLFTLPLSFLLLELFRRSNKRKSKTSKLEKALLDQDTNDQITKKKSNGRLICYSKEQKKVIFPWWFKLIAYLLAFTCMIVSAVIIIFKGKIQKNSHFDYV